jgi:hypothetical protein
MFSKPDCFQFLRTTPMRQFVGQPADEKLADNSPGEGARFVFIDPITDLSWQSFVLEHPESLIFHHPSWLGLLQRQYGFKTFAACVIRSGAVTAGVPLCEVRKPFGHPRWVCLPFSDRCGPLSTSSDDSRLLLEGVRLAAEESARRVLIRSRIASHSRFEMQGGQWLHTTDLSDDAEVIIKAFHPDVRRGIKKARSNGLVTEIRTDAAAMDAFYGLHLLTRRRQGVPIQPRQYFVLFLERIIQQGLGFVALVRRGQRYLSAGVFCTHKETVLYKYGASDPDGLTLCPNYLMLWDAMLHAKERKMKLFDFGTTSETNEGLRFFKNKWNSQETPLRYSHFPDSPSSRLHDAVLSRLLKPVIQHSPKFICRVSGEMLYKYFAA